jgi:hypothetical protein
MLQPSNRIAKTFQIKNPRRCGSALFRCPTLTRRHSVFVGIEGLSRAIDTLDDVETGLLVAPVQRWGRGRTVRALFFLFAAKSASIGGRGEVSIPNKKEDHFVVRV